MLGCEAENEREGADMLAKKLRMYRKRAGYSINDLAEIIGTSRQTIYRYETGSITNIPFERITQMARAFGVPMTELIEESPSRDFDILESGIYDHIYNDNGKYEEGAGFDTPILTMPIGVRRIPMLGEIACGEPRFASEEHDNFAIVSDDLSVDFCLRAHGDSMVGARIFDGDIVYIRKQEFVDNGEIAAVIIDDEATLKRVYYYPDEEKLVLSPENPKYPPLVYMGEELSDIKILGKAVAFQSSVI